MVASKTNLSDPMLRSNPNEYDRFSRKSGPLNLSSDWLFRLGDGSIVISPIVATSDSGGISANGSSIVLSIIIISSKLGRILAAITGVNGDSGRNIPARHNGQFACDRSHISIQSTWNACEHTGSVRT